VPRLTGEITKAENDYPHSNARRMAFTHGPARLRLVSPPRPISQETLIEKVGGDVLMPDVRHLIAECPRKDAPGAACGVFYADLRERSD
jgi:hypothetical protein